MSFEAWQKENTGFSNWQQENTSLAVEPEPELIQQDQAFDPSEPPGVEEQQSFTQQLIGTQAKGWMRLANVVLKAPKQAAKGLALLDPNLAAASEGRLANYEKEKIKVKADKDYKPPSWFGPMQSAEKDVGHYNKFVEIHT